MRQDGIKSQLLAVVTRSASSRPGLGRRDGGQGQQSGDRGGYGIGRRRCRRRLAPCRLLPLSMTAAFFPCIVGGEVMGIAMSSHGDDEGGGESRRG
jgi:hypothetical protein